MSDWYTPGWIDDRDAVQEIVGTLAHPDVEDTVVGEVDSSALPERVHLWEIVRRVTGGLLPPRNQGRVGACVGFGAARAIEYTMCAEIAAGDPEQFHALAAEVIYAGARVEVGNRRIRGDGAIGANAARWCRDWGVLARGVYGSISVETYSESRARQWGDQGVPDDLEGLARLHPVRDVTRVTSWAGAKKALASGYAISLCSHQGFVMRRNSLGICEASGRWSHCMTLCGYDRIDGVEVGRIDNSWGPDAHSGPTGPGSPGPEGFWARANIIESMLSSGDCWIFGSVEGFKVRKISWLI